MKYGEAHLHADLKRYLEQETERMIAEGDPKDAEIAALRAQVMKYENDEASVCPEDVGFVEYIGCLDRQTFILNETLSGLQAQLAAANARVEALEKALHQYYARHQGGSDPAGNDCQCVSCVAFRLAGGQR